MREGNERVVRPRLRDAAFFWEQDRKVPLELRAAELAGVTFQAKLGSYADKTARVEVAGGDDRAAASARRRTRRRGRAREGRSPDRHGRGISRAPGHHGPLLRRGRGVSRGDLAGDRGALPAAVRRRCAARRPRTGQALALADKIDTLVGIFAIEQRPTGAKDPFGLRRAALGVLRILLECRLDLDLVALIDASAAAQPVQRPQTSREV